jgi:hypothetical protein
MTEDDQLPPAIGSQMRVIRHLPTEGDLSLIVLKGHLLIEELLHALVQSSVPHPSSLDHANLSFHDIACVAESLFFEERHEHIWKSIHALNTLRNAYAHHIEPPKLDDLLTNLGIAMSKGDISAGKHLMKDPPNAIVIGLAVICGILSARLPLISDDPPHTLPAA